MMTFKFGACKPLHITNNIPNFWISYLCTKKCMVVMIDDKLFIFNDLLMVKINIFDHVQCTKFALFYLCNYVGMQKCILTHQIQ